MCNLNLYFCIHMNVWYLELPFSQKNDLFTHTYVSMINNWRMCACVSPGLLQHIERGSENEDGLIHHLEHSLQSREKVIQVSFHRRVIKLQIQTIKIIAHNKNLTCDRPGIFRS